MQFSPQSESIISGLLTGARLQSGDTVIGPLDAVTSAVLTVIAGGVDALSTQTGVERARNFLLSYQQIVKQQDEQKASGNTKPAPEHSTLLDATMRPPNAWRLVEVRATSYRGLAPIGEEIVFAFDGKCHLIYGPNGSGKSSLLGSIVWALTGQAMTDAEEQEVNADYFSPSQGGSRGKRLGQWPTHVTLPKADIKKVAPISRVILKLRSLEGSSEKWLSRSDSDGLALSDDGTIWKNCEDLGEIDISPLDLQLSLIAPMIFGRRPIERAEESRDILRLMLGFEDIATIGNLASDIGRNRTQLETAEKNNLQQLQDRIASTLSGLPNELAATHTLRASLVRLANDVGTLTEADIEEAAGLIDERVNAQEGAVAKAIGLDTVSNVHLDGIGEKLIRAVATLETGVAGSFPLFNALRATIILTATDADLSQQLARMNESLSLLIAEVTGRISKRYEWWRQETASNGRANLLLTAAQYYEPSTEQCPVCEQSISELPIKSELADL